MSNLRKSGMCNFVIFSTDLFVKNTTDPNGIMRILSWPGDDALRAYNKDDIIIFPGEMTSFEFSIEKFYDSNDLGYRDMYCVPPDQLYMGRYRGQSCRSLGLCTLLESQDGQLYLVPTGINPCDYSGEYQLLLALTTPGHYEYKTQGKLSDRSILGGKLLKRWDSCHNIFGYETEFSHMLFLLNPGQALEMAGEFVCQPRDIQEKESFRYKYYYFDGKDLIIGPYGEGTYDEILKKWHPFFKGPNF